MKCEYGTRLEECCLALFSLYYWLFSVVLFSETGGRRTDLAEELTFARQYFVTAVKSFGLQAIDLVSIDYKSMSPSQPLTLSSSPSTHPPPLPPTSSRSPPSFRSSCPQGTS